MYYKLGQACITNWGSFVFLQIRANVFKNWAASLLQIGVSVVTNWGNRYYKIGQLLKIGARITSQVNYYKLGHNKRNKIM